MIHTEGEILCEPGGEKVVSKTGESFWLHKSGNISCRGCCFGPKSKCKNGYNLCIKHHGEEYRDWIYVESREVSHDAE